MIVVDANILVYLVIDGDMSEAALRLQAKDPDWRTSPLWEYEFGNALTLMIVQKHLSTTKATQYLHGAKTIFSPFETPVDSELALQLAAEKRISFYDAQYLALAQTLDVPLITEDKALRKAAGNLAFSLHDFLN
jgi:predicted nucleic acid-binding protein